MRFSQYFEKWLYGEDGYYTKYNTIGKEGDFYTSVSTSKFFGGTIGKKIIDTIESGFLPSDTTIVEVGAHHGYLLSDIIEFINTLKPELIESLNFAIVERFEHLKQSQIEYFEKCFGDVISLKHYDDISEVKLDSAYVVANEIFDAFACELVYEKDEKRELVEIQDHEIYFVENNDKDLNQICDKYSIIKGEIALGYKEFAKSLYEGIKKFEFITFDYGELYHRNDFSTRIYHKHKVYPIFEENLELKKYFENSDITFDVHFSYLIDCFEEIGIKNIEFKTQLKALVDMGITQLLEMVLTHAGQSAYTIESGKVKTLLDPSGMGERFKMALFRKE